MTTMRVTDLLRDYHDGDEHGWDAEFALLRSTHGERLYELARDVLEDGMRSPILIGPDDRVWDGHHRLCVAHDFGIDEVPVEFA